VHHLLADMRRCVLFCAFRSSVRPGFEVGYQIDDKYYVNNHLMFKVLVHETNGQYTMSRTQGEAELEAAAAVEVRPGGQGKRDGGGRAARSGHAVTCCLQQLCWPAIWHHGTFVVYLCSVGGAWLLACLPQHLH